MPTTAEQNRRKHENRKIRRNELLRSQYPVVEEWEPVEDYGVFCLSGKIFNDPRFVDGSFVVTSGLVWIDHLLAKTARSKYMLGTPSVDYIRFREEYTLGPISTKRFHCGGNVPRKEKFDKKAGPWMAFRIRQGRSVDGF